ncbi:MAG: hypothetical protein M3451_12880 [Chloroflexota bacterium]|jgi:hypothetical protein|nr:hypothetical protein [Chloroflexota bacterium]
MMTQPLAAWPKWRDDLILQLRLKNVPGDRIGDILLEIVSHLAESGEAPDDAFGEPKHYAESRAVSRSKSQEDTRNVIIVALGAGIGGFLAASGAWGIGSGEDLFLNIPAWPGLIVGIAILGVGFSMLESDVVRDPRSGNPIFGNRWDPRLIIGGTFAIAFLILFLLGYVLGR